MKFFRFNDLPGPTSRLGFGCAAIASGSRREALRILQCAFDCGVRHFDVAPLYGLGLAEGILGDFLRGRREQVTVTTKFGLNPPPLATKYRSLTTLVKQILQGVPPISRFVRARLRQGVRIGVFNVTGARKSLETSLRELRTDYLDIWLLHEASITEANQSELLDFLADVQREGLIRAYGIGSDIRIVEDGFANLTAAHKIVQLENNVLYPVGSRLCGFDQRSKITHGALKYLRQIQECLRTDKEFLAKVHSETGTDLSLPERLAGTLLSWALDDNRNGIVLFSSSVPANIYANSKVVENIVAYLPAGRRLREWLSHKPIALRP